MPITDSVRTSGVKHLAAPGNSSRQYRIMPNVPTLSSTPTSSTAAPGCAGAAASGSQVWNGHSGALIAKAMKKPRNSHFCVVGSMGTCTSWLEQERAVVAGHGAARGDTYSAITAASMSRPPRQAVEQELHRRVLALPPP